MTSIVKPKIATKNIEVDIRQENGKAVIQGKTSVPFKVFVSLILQRKIQPLFKDSQNEPIIVSSELLTKLASAASDRVEDKGKLTLVTFAIGILCGVFLATCLLLIFNLFSIFPSITDLSILLGTLAGLGVLASIVSRVQRGPSAGQQLYEKMEKISDMLPR